MGRPRLVDHPSLTTSSPLNLPYSRRLVRRRGDKHNAKLPIIIRAVVVCPPHHLAADAPLSPRFTRNLPTKSCARTTRSRTHSRAKRQSASMSLQTLAQIDKSYRTSVNAAHSSYSFRDEHRKCQGRINLILQRLGIEESAIWDFLTSFPESSSQHLRE